MYRIAAVAAVIVVAACGGTSDETATTLSTTTPPEPTTTEAPSPAMSPAEVVFEAQTSDGTSIVIASVTIPSPGYIAVHGNAEGSPGAVVGHSDLLPAGTSTDVVVTLDQPLAASDLLFPMAHIDLDGDGEYLFAPPDDAVDLPATDAEGNVAVVGAEVTIEEASASDGASITIQGFSFGEPITVSAGEAVRISNSDGVSHTWTSATGLFDSGPITGGTNFSYTFEETGSYEFFCSIHPTMRGSIMVTG